MRKIKYLFTVPITPNVFYFSLIIMCISNRNENINMDRVFLLSGRIGERSDIAMTTLNERLVGMSRPPELNKSVNW